MDHLMHSEPGRKEKRGWAVWTIVLAVLLVLACVSCVYIIKKSVSNGIVRAQEGFLDTYSSTREDTYSAFKDTAYRIAEAENHVSNDVVITISAVKEKSALESMKISDVVYIITESDETQSGTSSWLKVSGTGVYTVDLAATEYLVDNDRHYVLLRVPEPMLDLDNISIDSFELLHFVENKWDVNNSIQSGERLANDQLRDAKLQMQQDFESSESYSKMAETSAASMLKALIQGLNPDVEDLCTEVEFY